jgi:hypothetical protein
MQLPVWIVTNGWIKMTRGNGKSLKYCELFKSEWYSVFKMVLKNGGKKSNEREAQHVYRVSSGPCILLVLSIGSDRVNLY